MQILGSGGWRGDRWLTRTQTIEVTLTYLIYRKYEYLNQHEYLKWYPKWEADQLDFVEATENSDHTPQLRPDTYISPRPYDPEVSASCQGWLPLHSSLLVWWVPVKTLVEHLQLVGLGCSSWVWHPAQIVQSSCADSADKEVSRALRLW